MKSSQFVMIIAIVVGMTTMASCHDKHEKTRLERYSTEKPRLLTAADSASFLYGVANGEGFITAVIKGRTGNLAVVKYSDFFDGLIETLEADSTTFANLSDLTINLDNLPLSQPELSRRFGIVAGMSARSYKSFYNIDWDNDKIAEGYFHGMAHDRTDVLPGPMCEEILREILFRIAPRTDSIPNQNALK